MSSVCLGGPRGVLGVTRGIVAQDVWLADGHRIEAVSVVVKNSQPVANAAVTATVTMVDGDQETTITSTALGQSNYGSSGSSAATSPVTVTSTLQRRRNRQLAPALDAVLGSTAAVILDGSASVEPDASWGDALVAFHRQSQLLHA